MTLFPKIKYSVIDYKHPDFQKVLELRLKAYTASDRYVVIPTTPQDTQDEYDQYSEIVVGKIGDRVVSSVRAVVYPAHIPIEQAPFMKNPPASSDCLGLGKFCVDPEFRGTLASVDTFAMTSVLTIKHGRKYLSGSGFEDIVKFYERAGSPRTGDVMEDTEHSGFKPVYVVLGVAKDIATNKTQDLKHWALVCGPIAIPILFGALNLSFFDRLRVLIRIPTIPMIRFLLILKILKKKLKKKNLSLL